MENSVNLFGKIMNDVKNKILCDVYYIGLNINFDSKYIQKKDMLYRRLDYLEEATVKYILSNVKACLHGSNSAAFFLNSYGIKSFKFNDVYDLRFLERCLNDVFFDLDCPGVLPSIDDINNDLLFFGFTSDADTKKFSSLYNALRNCNTPLFFEMYNIGVEKGLSNDEIFNYFSRIFKALEYYNYSPMGFDFLTYVPYLDVEIDEHFKSIGENFSMLKK